jgi:hypothetical protein
MRALDPDRIEYPERIGRQIFDATRARFALLET